MNYRRMLSVKLIATGALAIAASYGAAFAQTASIKQTAAGRLFVYHAPAAGECPALDWHILVGQNNTLSGIIAWNDMRSMAKATGSISPDGDVHITAKEQGGQGRTATITGKLRQDGWIFADVNGPGIKCKNVAVSYYTAPAGGSGG